LLFVSFDSILTQQMGSFGSLTRYSIRSKLLCIRRSSAPLPYFNNLSITSNFYTTQRTTSRYQLPKQNSFNMQFFITTTAFIASLTSAADIWRTLGGGCSGTRSCCTGIQENICCSLGTNVSSILYTLPANR